MVMLILATCCGAMQKTRGHVFSSLGLADTVLTTSPDGRHPSQPRLHITARIKQVRCSRVGVKDQGATHIGGRVPQTAKTGSSLSKLYTVLPARLLDQDTHLLFASATPLFLICRREETQGFVHLMTLSSLHRHSQLWSNTKDGMT